MVLKKIRDINRKICRDFCDLSGADGNHTIAWICAILLDIVIPIVLFISGITIALGGMLMNFFFPPAGAIIAGIAAIAVALIALACIAIVAFIEFRQIGPMFMAIPIGMAIFIFFLSLIPFIGLLGIILSFIPWNMVAVFLHTIAYRRSVLKPTII